MIILSLQTSSSLSFTLFPHKFLKEFLWEESKRETFENEHLVRLGIPGQLHIAPKVHVVSMDQLQKQTPMEVLGETPPAIT